MTMDNAKNGLDAGKEKKKDDLRQGEMLAHARLADGSSVTVRKVPANVTTFHVETLRKGVRTKVVLYLDEWKSARDALMEVTREARGRN